MVNNTGAIVGSAAGALVLIVGISLLLAYLRNKHVKTNKRKKNNRRSLRGTSGIVYGRGVRLM